MQICSISVRILLITVCLVASTRKGAAQSAESDQSADTGLAPGLDGVSFFVGQWDVDVLSADRSQVIGKARTNVYPILDGMALQADYYGLNATGAAVFRGTTIRTHVPTTNSFVVHWAMAGIPGFTYLNERLENDELRAEGHGEDGGGEFLERYRYFGLSDSTYSFEMSRSYDDGETWQPFSNLQARKSADSGQ